MLIRDLLTQKTPAEIECIRPEATLRDTAGKMTAHGIGALIVADERGRLLGIVSERDLVKAIPRFGGGLLEKTVGDVMTEPVVVCALDDSVTEAFGLMSKNGIRHVPVAEGGTVKGIISTRELELAYKDLKIQAGTDPLTGLANRRQFFLDLNAEISRFRRYHCAFSVAMVDIDHFKRVNDTFGHAAGDRVLEALADLLVHELRDIDRVGRVGGEEFALLLPDTDLEQARLACDRLLAAIRAAEVEVDGGKIAFTVSIGLTEVTPATLDAESILKRADGLLYDAKACGRNRIETDADCARRRIGDKDRNASVGAIGLNEIEHLDTR